MENATFFTVGDLKFIIRGKELYKIYGSSYIIGGSIDLLQTKDDITEFFKELFKDNAKEHGDNNFKKSISGLKGLLKQLGYSVECFEVKREAYVKLSNNELSLYFSCLDKKNYSETSEEIYNLAKKLKMMNIKRNCDIAGIDFSEFENLNSDIESVHELTQELKNKQSELEKKSEARKIFDQIMNSNEDPYDKLLRERGIDKNNPPIPPFSKKNL